MMVDMWTAFILIFVAEFGDKSQLLAMTLATRYRIKTVLAGVAIGIVANHAIAILLGQTITKWLDPSTTGLLVGAIFVGFGLLSLRQEADASIPRQHTLPGLLVVSGLFFLGEFADKTQFATMALAMESSHPWWLLLGTTSAMMTTSALAIWIGKTLGDRFQEGPIRMVSSQMFIGYGLLRIVQSLPGGWWPSIAWSIAIVALDAMLVVRSQRVKQSIRSTWKQRAQDLYEYYHQMTSALDHICLGVDVCGSCETQGCLIGHVKHLIEQGKAGHPVSMSQLSTKTWRQVESSRVQAALDLTLVELKGHWDDPSFAPLHLIRQNLEYLLYKKVLRSPTWDDYHNDRLWLNQKRGV